MKKIPENKKNITYLVICKNSEIVLQTKYMIKELNTFTWQRTLKAIKSMMRFIVKV